MKRIPFIKINGEYTTKDGLTAEQLLKKEEIANAEGLFIYDESVSFDDSEKAISFLRVVCNGCKARVFAKVRAHKQEDVKKILYAGCSAAVIELSDEVPTEYLKDVSERFGKEKIIALVQEFSQNYFDDKKKAYVSAAIYSNCEGSEVTEDSYLLDEDNAILCVDDGFTVSSLKKHIKWSEFKKLKDGLVPCVVQDAKNDDVLMVAYMNEEAYEATIRTGRMTYFSRSRNELWIKGETSGHYQYLKSLSIDCDNDTLLARVEQIGAACHTGNRSCFFTDIYRDDSYNHSPNKVFTDVYNIIEDRKINPKEGSYTNYLFEKGIDKILKKVGEEATEIVIAAKNPDKEEVKYEIADFLYHAIVLMVEKGLTWEEVTVELARR